MRTVTHALAGIVYEWEINEENVKAATNFLQALGKNTNLYSSDSEILSTALTLKSRYAMDAQSPPSLDIDPVGGWLHS